MSLSRKHKAEQKGKVSKQPLHIFNITLCAYLSFGLFTFFLVTFAIHFCTEATCTEKLVSVQIDMEQSPQFKYVRICRACAMCMRKLFFIRKIVSVKKGIANSKKLYVNETL